MKQFMTLFLILVFPVTQSGFSQLETDLFVNVYKLSPRAIVLSIDGPLDNNVIALQSQKGLVVIDTYISPSISFSIRKKIEEVFNCKDFRYVIYTHSHGDHTWGSQVFSEATFIAHNNCLNEMAGIQDEVSGDIERTQNYIDHLENQLKNIESSSQEYREKNNTAAFYKNIVKGWSKDFSPILPNITFTEKLRLDLGDMHLILTHFPEAHSKSDIIIFCPEEDLLLTGDLFVPGMNPSFLKTETVPMIPAWISALEQTRSDEKVPSYVIPGHGDFLKPEEMNVICEYFQDQLSSTQGKKSAFSVFKKILAESGAQAALEKLKEMAGSEEYFLLENDLSSQGYFWLYREKKTAEAIAIFKIMTEIFPDSWNAWDCLGEGYMTNDDAEQAVHCYQKSLALNPDNTNGLAMLKRLSEKK
jgi:glyoxylase-like metal-dependent hydrolase (beta-lactamase superfamily II)